ncbi:rhodanese-like domain-containing protein [Bacteriovorax sp. PP10]|uniref:Rhodanese-like domain-containing protein n=1 Tax=Bacteriovorax antarcticus TaxID=3088717 RepID=A0ABU5VQS4_9BACT|nr:rhodanese-like domain-containing protein [Bacteriovorax sp. PP10]MEA9355351.1 rhodanese-like domain-containing protein [Bacteriovorax sp. PP10]
MKKTLLLILSIVSITTLSATEPAAAYKMLTEGKAVIVDVREEDEIKLGMIEKALWFPLSKVNNDKNWKEQFQKLTQGKQIFLYCRSGNRSEKVKNILKANSIESENIGGFESLKKQLPTQRGVK